MLETIAGNPCTYKVTSVDSVTERFYEGGSTRGFLVLNVTQDLYNPETDNAELMICDYVAPPEEEPDPPIDLSIRYSGTPTIRYGGSPKKFFAALTDDTENTPIAVDWEVQVDPTYDGMISSRVDGSYIWLSAADDVRLIGVVVVLVGFTENSAVSIELEVIS